MKGSLEVPIKGLRVEKGDSKILDYAASYPGR